MTAMLIPTQNGAIDTSEPPGARGFSVSLTPGQARATFDKDYRKANPARAALDGYHGIDDPNRSLWTAAGRLFRGLARGPVRTVAGWGPWPAATVGAGAGAAAGYGLGWLADRLLGRNLRIPGLLLGTLLGGGTMHSLGTMAKESAAYDARRSLARVVQADPSLAVYDKMRISAAVESLGQEAASRLASMLPAAAGAGIGVLIARMLGLGLVGSAVGGLLGAFAGSRFGRETDGLGNPLPPA